MLIEVMALLLLEILLPFCMKKPCENVEYSQLSTIIHMDPMQTW